MPEMAGLWGRNPRFHWGSPPGGTSFTLVVHHGTSMSQSRPSRRRAVSLVAVLGLVLPLGVVSQSVAATTTTTSTTSPASTTTTTTAPPTPSEMARAQSLLDVFRRTATTLDQLETTYLDARAKVAVAKWNRNIAEGQLAATTATYERLRARAVALAVRRYETSSAAAGGGLSQFSSPAAAGQVQNAGVYDAVAATKLDPRVRAVEQLRTIRAGMAAVAQNDLHQAATARTTARTSLRSARRADAHLLAILATLDPGTRRALVKLQSAGDDAVAHLLTSGSLVLRTGVANPPAVLPQATAAVAFAAAQLGKPYRWGATGPDSFDCSGLVLEAWKAAGVTLPRVAIDQAAATLPVSFQDLQPGDLVFFESPIGHVGIYVGDGSMIDAPYTGASVQIDSIFWKDLAGFGRVTQP